MTDSNHGTDDLSDMQAEIDELEKEHKRRAAERGLPPAIVDEVGRIQSPDVGPVEGGESDDENHAPDGTTILKVPLVPFVSGCLLISTGAVMAIAVDPGGVMISILGFAGLAYQRDVQIYGNER